MGDYHYPAVDPSLGDGSATFAAGGGGGGPGGSGNKKRRMGSMSPDDGDDDVKPLQGKDAPGAKGGASEFVKKLYRMLEDAAFAEIVSWGYTGDSFVVKDMNSFTRSILPLHFKHSNFASFVRQLNKYDFHKVKNPEDGGSPYGEHTWEFKHPNFRSDMKDSLEHIKRKAPAPRKATPTPALARSRPNGHAPPDGPTGDFASLQQQIEQLHRTQQGMSQHMNNISQDYQVVMGEMMNFQRNMVAQDQLMQNLIQYLVNLEADQKALGNPAQPEAPFVPSSQAQKLISSYTEVARASYDQMADLSRRASLSGGSLPPIPPPPPGFGHFEMQRGGGPGPSPQQGRRDEPGPPPGSGFDGRESVQYGGGGGGARRSEHSQHQHHQQPPPQHQHQQHPGQHSQQQHPQQREQQQREQHQRDQQQREQQQQRDQQREREQTQQAQAQAQAQSQQPNSTSRQLAPANRPLYIPGWAVPPRVLLVEDDAVCRKLSTKFLQVFGCSIDVAEDGVSAVNKMNTAVEKYDLVLMDIVMPNLDGVSATSLIRQFDPMTPIISMTSNSGPNDIMTYFSHGMNDILPKPFTKEGLLGMLEKHLIHLKVMQQMAEIPRALGFSTDQIQDALGASVVSEEGNVMNPFSAMGISDDDYLVMLQQLTEGKGPAGTKVQALEVVHENGTAARFREVPE
ncbi:hypothetical protein RQP46_010779 [Phenoliferia psychrophenolica]